MKNINFFLFAAFAVLLAACKGGDGGMLTSPNGYKYVKFDKGTGPNPKVGEYGFVHISVYQNDSLVNSTYQMGRTVPIIVPDLALIPADQKGVGKANPVSDLLALMKVGDSVSVDVPIDSLMMQNPNFQGVKKMTYAFVLMDIKTKEQYDASQMEEQKVKQAEAGKYKEQEAAVATQLASILKEYKSGANKAKLQTTTTGLKYLVLEEGTGAQAVAGKGVDVMYYGMLTDGKEFDNSYKRGQPFSFGLGQRQVIPGWDEGIALMKEGGKAVLFIPYELGYGEQGNPPVIPGKAELVFYVELQKVK
jgi:FKBP-type peptidyl-prolyl cis-trans isomerase FkpA